MRDTPYKLNRAGASRIHRMGIRGREWYREKMTVNKISNKTKRHGSILISLNDCAGLFSTRDCERVRICGLASKL